MYFAHRPREGCFPPASAVVSNRVVVNAFFLCLLSFLGCLGCARKTISEALAVLFHLCLPSPRFHVFPRPIRDITGVRTTFPGFLREHLGKRCAGVEGIPGSARARRHIAGCIGERGERWFRRSAMNLFCRYFGVCWARCRRTSSCRRREASPELSLEA